MPPKKFDIREEVIVAKKEKKILKHPFYDRFTVLGAIVLAAVGMLISQGIIGSILGGLVQGICKAARPDIADTAGKIAIELFAAFGAFITLALFRRWFYPEYEGGIKGGQRVGRWTLICLAIAAALLIVEVATEYGRLGVPSAVNLAAAIMAGVCEEAAFRGMSASYLMRQWKGEKNIPKVMILSSVLFGLIHAMNLLSGAPVGMTVIQIFNAFAVGCMLCAIFLRCGSLIPAMILHALNDIIAFTSVSTIAEGGSYKSTATVSYADLWSQILLTVAFLAAAIYLTRPAVREEICVMWEKKWIKR